MSSILEESTMMSVVFYFHNTVKFTPLLQELNERIADKIILPYNWYSDNKFYCLISGKKKSSGSDREIELVLDGLHYEDVSVKMMTNLISDCISLEECNIVYIEKAEIYSIDTMVELSLHITTDHIDMTKDEVDFYKSCLPRLSLSKRSFTLKDVYEINQKSR